MNMSLYQLLRMKGADLKRSRELWAWINLGGVREDELPYHALSCLFVTLPRLNEVEESLRHMPSVGSVDRLWLIFMLRSYRSMPITSVDEEEGLARLGGKERLEACFCGLVLRLASCFPVTMISPPSQVFLKRVGNHLALVGHVSRAACDENEIRRIFTRIGVMMHIKLDFRLQFYSTHQAG